VIDQLYSSNIKRVYVPDRMKEVIMVQAAVHSYVDTFFSEQDAYTYLEGHKKDHPDDEWEIIEYRINLLGGGFRAGIVFQKKQLELAL
jgi:hypothetical protein